MMWLFLLATACKGNICTTLGWTQLLQLNSEAPAACHASLAQAPALGEI
jgi:hypothetical protein